MRFLRQLARIVALDTAIALVPPILALALERNVTFAFLLTDFAYSAVYANVIGGMANFIVPRLWPRWDRYAKPARWIFRGLLLLAIAIAGSLIAGLIFVGLGWMSAADYWPQFAGAVRMSILITFALGGAIAFYETMRGRLDETTLALRTQELERTRALKLATEAQLASLESRIHPHFLFNTLNSISSLIPEDPKAAERLVERMAALLRFSLDANHTGLVPLEHEMKIVADYLEIEKARFGERLRYRLDVPAALNGARVPPLAVQTLVENSVKHAVARNRAGGEIRVRGRLDGAALALEVFDSGSGFRFDAVPPGHGLDNLQSRLAALFGSEGKLGAKEDGAGHSVYISVPYSPNGHPGISG